MRARPQMESAGLAGGLQWGLGVGKWEIWVRCGAAAARALMRAQTIRGPVQGGGPKAQARANMRL